MPRGRRCRAGSGGFGEYSLWALVPLILCLLVACAHREWQTREIGPHTARRAHPSEFLKAHLHDGQLFVFDSWWIDEDASQVGGRGLHYDSERQLTDRGTFTVPLGDVALLETTEPHRISHAGPIVLGIVTGASLVVTAVCVASPKTCFGSCPTFYVRGADGMVLDAEGFSESVAEIYEARDVDALPSAAPDGGQLTLVMRNEALESHYVRSLSLLAVPRGDGERVLRSGDSFFRTLTREAPSRCASGGELCTEAVAARDGDEYSPAPDPEDLGATQTIELEFEPERVFDQPGLVISARNSLVGTFLFYQLLAWLGTSAGEMMRRVEAGDPLADRAFRAGRVLGRIDVEVKQPDGSWEPAGSYDEVGPIAADRQVIPLPHPVRPGPVIVRLRATRGYWRFDEVALAALGAAAEPIRVSPSRASRLIDGEWQDASDALVTVLDEDARLETFPGDSYRFSFEGIDGDPALFLESRGYYYEWIREQWLAEEDPTAAARFMLDFRGTLRRLAPAYERIRPAMDELFFESRIGEPIDAR